MKNCVIIGASSGIGLETVRTLSKEYNVLAISRTINDELRETGVQTLEHTITPDSTLDPANFFEELHALVYCPGSISLKPFHRNTIQDFRNDLDQNVLGAVRAIQLFLPLLKRSGNASVVLFSSVAAQLGLPFHSSISTAKAALEGLTRSLAAELAATNIRVNAIAPSLSDTKLAAGLLSTEEKRQAGKARNPLQRIGDPVELAGIARFLLSQEASWITGQIIHADGGMVNLKV